MSFISRSRYLSAVVISRRIVLGLGVATKRDPLLYGEPHDRVVFRLKVLDGEHGVGDGVTSAYDPGRFLVYVPGSRPEGNAALRMALYGRTHNHQRLVIEHLGMVHETSV